MPSVQPLKASGTVSGCAPRAWSEAETHSLDGADGGTDTANALVATPKATPTHHVSTPSRSPGSQPSCCTPLIPYLVSCLPLPYLVCLHTHKFAQVSLTMPDSRGPLTPSLMAALIGMSGSSRLGGSSQERLGETITVLST
jgi:hypothetical protein